MRADCHLAQYTDYEDPSDTSFLEEESSPLSPDLDFTNHQTNSFDDIDYSSPSQNHDIPEDSFDYNDDNFLDHDHDHDLTSTYLSYPAEIVGLPCSTTPQTLDTPSSSLSPTDASNNLNPNKEMIAEPMPNTACPDKAVIAALLQTALRLRHT